MQEIATIANNISLRWRNRRILNNISFHWPEGSQVLLTGAPGSGKTLLTKAISGELFHEGSIRFEENGKAVKPLILRVEQHYHFRNRAHVNQFYYQQRFNSIDADDTATVEEELAGLKADPEALNALLERFSMGHRFNSPLLHLSSGEHKRFQLIRAFLQDSQIMILDEPYTGMDTRSREILHDLICEKITEGRQFILICEPSEAPDLFDTIFSLDESNGQYKRPAIKTPAALENLPALYDTMVEMKNTSIRYGNRVLLTGIDWTIKPGECWWLKGVNGSGKSTLLSLITGDNPKAYANHLILFDRKRGTGESIWDIKKNIGFVSPELQWYFENSSTVFATVASGLFDTIGLFRQLTASETVLVSNWLEAFDLVPEKDQPLSMLSTSQQRLALLARAMVKNPALLVLDEPCQGLSDKQAEAFNSLVNRFCADPQRSLIYVTHYENELPDCIEHKIELDNGTAHTQFLSFSKTISA